MSSGDRIVRHRRQLQVRWVGFGKEHDPWEGYFKLLEDVGEENLAKLVHNFKCDQSFAEALAPLGIVLDA
ncbi:hypothetical protein T484DRAFT_1862515 [Baffinella frigidus]|nr:hypothetical protein T484DRAFT_1862515 [Cryptophyta sp. CCMP2293]